MEVDLKIGDDWLDMEEIKDEKESNVYEVEKGTVQIQQNKPLCRDNIAKDVLA